MQVTVAWPNTSTLQTTTCAKEYMRTMVEDKDHQRKLQRGKNYTATIGVHNAASTYNLHKGMPLNFCPYPQFNGIPYSHLNRQSIGKALHSGAFMLSVTLK